ncbi:hypothetical protein EDD86DRAFT_68431 [Gorgonomyces haynaldii]|nr:hypothetical protein EDD86DRAFT_68431 [Gorgonomyces haynaldii]
MLAEILFFCLAFLNAQTPNQVTTADVAQAFSGQSIASGILLIVSGFVLSFFGFRLFKPTLFLAGMALFTFLGYVLLVRVEPSAGYNPRETILLLGSLAIGLVGGFLAFFFFNLGVTILGALGGASLAMFLLSWKVNGIIEGATGQAIFIAVFALIFAVAIHFIEKPVIIGSTSILGAHLLFNGIDVFAQVGFAQAQRRFLGGDVKLPKNEQIINQDGKTYGLLVGMLVFIAIAIVVQFRMTRERKSFKNSA